MADIYGGLSRELAEFVVSTNGSTIGEDVRMIASRAFVDTLGCGVAGTTNSIGRAIIDYVGQFGSGGFSPTFSGGSEASLLDSVMLNATLSHCSDFDDTNHPLYGHPSAVLVPVAAGMGRDYGASGHDMVTAYLVGHEIEVAFARAINHDHYEQGFHATGSLGIFGAAACASRLMGLNSKQVGHALATAASMSAGLRANVGSMTKSLHAGMAASNGIRAAQLASLGWESAADTLERSHTGFFAAYAAGKEPNVAAALNSLGITWAIAEPFGQQIKPYPACGATHPPIEAAIELHRQLDGDISRIASIQVGVPALTPGILVFDDPRTGNEARFSLTYTVCRGLAKGRVDMASFSDDAVFDRDVRSLMEIMHYEVDERVRNSSEFGSIVTVTTHDGERIEERSDLALGKNAKPMSEAQLREKFDGCLAVASDRDGERLWQTWRGVDEVGSAQELWETLSDWWRE